MILMSDELNSETENYLKDQGYLMPDEEIIKYEKAGEGNMNLVVRITTDAGKVIVKQSRPYVNKYPQIAAPLNRIILERQFYLTIKDHPLLKKYSPEVFDFDDENYTLLMEDLGQGTNYLGLYNGKISISDNELNLLLDYLVCLHGLKNIKFPDNNEMKALNHQHIFSYPFMEENGFNLDHIQPGLQELALSYKKDENLKAEIHKIGLRYLENGRSLLHGDFYPGSWLSVNDKVRVIDPEFAFVGDAEFDLGVMIANLYMAAVDQSRIEECIKYYGSKSELDPHLLNKYVGIEILRRVIGLAQLPLRPDLDFKSALCQTARNFILGQ